MKVPSRARQAFHKLSNERRPEQTPFFSFAGFFIAVFFSSSKLAAIVAPFAHFAAIMPRYVFFRTNQDQAIFAKCLAGFLPSTAFTFGECFSLEVLLMLVLSCCLKMLFAYRVS